MEPLFCEIAVVGGPEGLLHEAVWRDPGRAGPRLMAADEALLHEVPVPAVRFYVWERPWISIGYFEKNTPSKANLPVVRRWTGGGLVYHRPLTELTYALSVPRSHPFCRVSPVESYRRVHAAVQAALAACGISSRLCADRPAALGGDCFITPMPGDVLADDSEEKLAGAGQRRHRLGLLHQGSIQLRAPVPAMLPDRLVAFLAKRGKRDPITDAAILRRSGALLAERYEGDHWLHPKSGRRG